MRTEGQAAAEARAAGGGQASLAAAHEEIRGAKTPCTGDEAEGHEERQPEAAPPRSRPRREGEEEEEEEAAARDLVTCASAKDRAAWAKAPAARSGRPAEVAPLVVGEVVAVVSGNQLRRRWRQPKLSHSASDDLHGGGKALKKSTEHRVVDAELQGRPP